MNSEKVMVSVIILMKKRNIKESTLVNEVEILYFFFLID